MDRQMVYPGQIPLETDLLNSNKNAMLALAKLCQAVLGTAQTVHGFACTPTSPASMSVVVGPGEVYSLQNVDGSAYSSLAADTAHQIVKQGMVLDPTSLSLTAPSTPGYSVNYLIQVAYTDVDSGNVVLPYYNSANPAQAFSGAGNNGQAQPTVRKGAVTLQSKVGVAATTGTQTTPAPDSGFTGLWVVTLANGQAAITTANIGAYSGANSISSNSVTSLTGLAAWLLDIVAASGLTVDPTASNPAQLKAGLDALYMAKGATVSHASTADSATNAGHAGTADNATNAYSCSGNAASASYCSGNTAGSSSSCTGTAAFANNAQNANFAQRNGVYSGNFDSGAQYVYLTFSNGHTIEFYCPNPAVGFPFTNNY